MSPSTRQFELPKKIDRYLAAVSKSFGQEGKRQLQEIIVNAQTRVHEEWNGDNWNGGTYGHALYLVIPGSLFLNTRARTEAFPVTTCGCWISAQWALTTGWW